MDNVALWQAGYLRLLAVAMLSESLLILFEKYHNFTLLNSEHSTVPNRPVPVI